MPFMKALDRVGALFVPYEVVEVVHHTVGLFLGLYETTASP